MQKEIEELDNSIAEAEQELEDLKFSQGTNPQYSKEDYEVRKKGLKQEILDMRHSRNILKLNLRGMHLLQ